MILEGGSASMIFRALPRSFHSAARRTKTVRKKTPGRSGQDDRGEWRDKVGATKAKAVAEAK
jgi:hypothetical protein